MTGNNEGLSLARLLMVLNSLLDPKYLCVNRSGFIVSKSPPVTL